MKEKYSRGDNFMEVISDQYNRPQYREVEKKKHIIYMYVLDMIINPAS